MTNDETVHLLTDVELDDLITTNGDPLVRRLAENVKHARANYRTALGELGRVAETARPALDEISAIRTLMSRNYHIVHIKERGFGLQHGFPCRADLLGCPVNRALSALEDAPAPPGYYRVRLAADGAIVIGEPVDPGTDLLVDGLKSALGL